MTLIRAPFSNPEVLEKLRPAYEAQRSLLLPGGCDPSAAPAKVRFSKMTLATRGRYQFADLRDRAISRELLEFAQVLAGRKLAPHALRLLRFRHRGYALFYDDALTRVEAGVEVTLDVSSQMRGTPAVYQTNSTDRLEVPQVPGLVAVVERHPGMYRYDRYLPAAVGDAEVLRLRAAFRFAD